MQRRSCDTEHARRYIIQRGVIGLIILTAMMTSVQYMPKIIYYSDISSLALKEGHLSGLAITIRLRKFSARIFEKWITVRERLELNVRRNNSALLMILDYVIMLMCELAIRVMFPKLRYVMGYISHFRASCSSEHKGEVVDFAILPTLR